MDGMHWSIVRSDLRCHTPIITKSRIITSVYGFSIRQQYIYIYIYRNTHTYTYTYIHIHIYIYIYMCVCVHIWQHAIVRIYLCCHAWFHPIAYDRPRASSLSCGLCDIHGIEKRHAIIVYWRVVLHAANVWRSHVLEERGDIILMLRRNIEYSCHMCLTAICRCKLIRSDVDNCNMLYV